MIFALVTLYNPSQNVQYNIEKLAVQVDKVVLLDNSNDSNEELFKKLINIQYKPNYENLGLSIAFNKYLKNQNEIHDDDFVFFFDQDSIIPDCHIAKMIKEYERIQSQNINIGILGPVYYNNSSGRIEESDNTEFVTDYSFYVDRVITSSMLCQFKTIKEVGFWNEEIFLDMADWDLCWRLLNYGKKCCMTTISVLQHQIGKKTKKIGPFRIIYDREIREYYQIRDGLKLLKKKYLPRRYVYYLIYMLTLRIILETIFFKKKRLRLRMYFKGILDYKNRINGAYL